MNFQNKAKCFRVNEYRKILDLNDTFIKETDFDEIEQKIAREIATCDFHCNHFDIESIKATKEEIPFSNKDDIVFSNDQKSSYKIPEKDGFTQLFSTQVMEQFHKELNEKLTAEDTSFSNQMQNTKRIKLENDSNGGCSSGNDGNAPTTSMNTRISNNPKDHLFDVAMTDLNATINEKMTQLLKSTHYRNEVSQLFETLEQSICQFGSKDTLKNNILEEEILSCFNQEGDGGIGDIIKKALRENLNKSLFTKKLVNSTLTSNKPTFEKLGTYYGLPEKVRQLVRVLKGIENLYDWQDECLNLSAIKDRKNLIYSLPTSGGKTLVAEILILREILCRKRNALFVLPYVSIVQEKVWSLSPFAVELDFLVEEYAAGKGTYPPRKRRHKNSVYVATTEKALGLINSLIEKGRLSELSLIVVDELHLIGDCQRGPTLEVLLTKLMYMMDDIQIVGMSATIGNLSDISKFLNAEVYTRNFRPVELIEYVKCGSKIVKVDLNADEDNIFKIYREVSFNYSNALCKIDPDYIGGLVMETIPNDSCLVFCPTKKNCENVTKLLCQVLKSNLKLHKQAEKQQLLIALRNDGGTICSIFEESIPFGVAYHHSGLTLEERKLIEESYKTGVLCVICCTSTLAAGVNLPAQRVIIRKPYIAQKFINLSRYKQMIGRAGRAGLGKIGESILLCKSDEISNVKQLFLQPMDQTLSKLHETDYSRLMNLFLSCISLGTANTKEQLKVVISKTLLSVQQEKLDVNVHNIVKKILCYLYKLGAIEINNVNANTSITSDSSIICTTQDSSKTTNSKVYVTVDNNTRLQVSKLGNAALKGNLNLREVNLLYEDLTKAKDSLVLLNCLHLLYLVTPYNLIETIKPQKNHFHYIMMQLGTDERKTAAVLGISESCIVQMLSNKKIKSVSENVLNRFYISLMLYDLWNETSVIDVSEKYQVSRGIVQNLMTNASTFATNVVMFCEQLDEFWAFVFLLKGMSQRLAHCCSKDLLPLMELPAVKQTRARQLFNAGFKNLQSIAKTDAHILIQKIDFMTRKTANQLISAAKMLLLEKVENLREEAEDVLDGVDEK
ncbi:hypothetical protein FQA39_LY16470 [Lamprigera yunnana]|nr:hypothetical protein FQA39_LY16470 [Lamprigera yunnana]